MRANSNQAFLCRDTIVFLLTIGMLLLVPSTIGSMQTPTVSLSQPLSILWHYDSNQTSNFTSSTDGASVFLPLANGSMVALDTSNGKLRWKAEIGGNFSASPVADTQNVYAAGQYSNDPNDQRHARGSLRALSKLTGVTIWLRTLQAPLSGSLVVGDRAVFAGSVDGKVYAFDKRNGLTLWVSQNTESFSSHPMLSSGRLYIGSEQGSLFSLDENTGIIVWRYRTLGPIEGPISADNVAVYFGSGDGYVYAVKNAKAQLIWKRRTGAAVQAVVIVGGGLLAASLDNYAYRLSIAKGSLIWRRQLPGRISACPATATDGALFTPLSADSAIVLSLSDGKPVNTLALGEENSSAAAPIAVNDLVLITTAHGLLAFARPRDKP